jgi:hypothetical protein
MCWILVDSQPRYGVTATYCLWNSVYRNSLYYIQYFSLLPQPGEEWCYIGVQLYNECANCRWGLITMRCALPAASVLSLWTEWHSNCWYISFILLRSMYYSVTYSTKNSLRNKQSLESQDILCLLWNLTVYYCIQRAVELGTHQECVDHHSGNICSHMNASSQ